MKMKCIPTKLKCIHTFQIEDRRKGVFTVNEGEIWEMKFDMLVRNGVGIKVMPWHIYECFEEIKE